MAAQGPNARIRIQLLLALAGQQDLNVSDQLEPLAKDLGLSGAEIDAARAGRCFDARAGAAVNLALALRGGDPVRVERARLLAGRSGFGADDLAVIERLAGMHDHNLNDRSIRNA